MSSSHRLDRIAAESAAVAKSTISTRTLPRSLWLKTRLHVQVGGQSRCSDREAKVLGTGKDCEAQAGGDADMATNRWAKAILSGALAVMIVVCGATKLDLEATMQMQIIYSLSHEKQRCVRCSRFDTSALVQQAMPPVAMSSSHRQNRRAAESAAVAKSTISTRTLPRSLWSNTRLHVKSGLLVQSS